MNNLTADLNYIAFKDLHRNDELITTESLKNSINDIDNRLSDVELLPYGATLPLAIEKIHTIISKFGGNN